MLVVGDCYKSDQCLETKSKTGCKDIPIGFTHIRKGLDYGRLLRLSGSGKNKRTQPDVSYLELYGIDAPLHNQYDGFVVSIFPRSDQVDELKAFFRRGRLKFSMTGIEADSYMLFGRYEYSEGNFQDTIRCTNVLARLSPIHHDLAVQLGLKFGRLD